MLDLNCFMSSSTSTAASRRRFQFGSSFGLAGPELNLVIVETQPILLKSFNALQDIDAIMGSTTIWIPRTHIMNYTSTFFETGLDRVSTKMDPQQ
jgi:hypothetical protein